MSTAINRGKRLAGSCRPFFLRNATDRIQRRKFGSSAYACLMALCLFLMAAFPAAAQSQDEQIKLGPDFENPKDIRYNGGNIELDASKNKVKWQGKDVETNVYSAFYGTDRYPASYTPPTIRVNPGTTLSLRLMSQIDYAGANPCDHKFTNLHYHGFEVSPMRPQDNVFIRIPGDGNPYQYRVVLPHDHPEGMFWYHPHPHGCSFWQVNGGMSGILIVGDLLRQYPEYRGIVERILLLKDGDPTPQGAQEEQQRVLKVAAAPDTQDPDPISVNGMSQPNIRINSRERQFFRIGNVGTDSFIKVAFDPPVDAQIIAVDGMATEKKIPLNSDDGWLLPPGSRVEMVVTGPQRLGVYKLVSRAVPRAVAPPPDTVLATLEVKAGSAPASGEQSSEAPAQGPKVHSAYYPKLEDFAEAASPDACVIHTKPPTGDKYKGCDFVFSQSGTSFLINNKTYEENRTDVTCRIGKEIEWTLCNDTGEHHAFHIHQIHFDVLSINGQPVEAPIRDVVDLPNRPDPNSVGKTRIKMNFKYDYLAGKFVLHCHMLFHEDNGMMMNVEMLK